LMRIEDLKNKPIAVLGYGQEGEAVAKYLIKHRLEPVLFDQRPWDKWPKKKQEVIKKLGINFIFGPDCFKELAGFEVAFRSPGIPLSHPDLLNWPNLMFTSQTKWFFEHCPAKIIGVTGTKGKGTTSALIYQILLTNNYSLPTNVYFTGNIGKDQPLDFLDDLKSEDWVIYELSSFQLQDLTKSPHIAVVLMTTSEHLDYHKDNEEYQQAKNSITMFQTNNDFAIINADYPASVKIGEQGKGMKFYFSARKELERGCYIKDSQLIVIDVLGKNFQYPISNIQLRGRHNLENVSAAVSAGALLKIGGSVIQQAIDGFKGLEHRLEFVAEKQGIKFYNDSFSTTPETAIAAIKSFDETLIVILGGSKKNSDFRELGKTISRTKNIKALILIGQEALIIKRAILSFSSPPGEEGGEGGRTDADKTPLILESAKDMKDIFNQIKQIAAPGDIVLLSPACASFDMFKNYEDRGKQFKKLAADF